MEGVTMPEQANASVTCDSEASEAVAGRILCPCGCGLPVVKRRGNQIYASKSCRERYWADYYSRLRGNARSIEAQNAKLRGQRSIFDRPMDEKDHLILGHLEAHKGRENPIPRRELAGRVQLTTRQLERRIKALVEHHDILIGSATGEPHGYYIPTDPAEIAMVVGQLLHRATSIIRRVAKIRKVAEEEIFGQMRMK